MKYLTISLWSKILSLSIGYLLISCNTSVTDGYKNDKRFDMITINILPEERPDWVWKAEEAVLRENGIVFSGKPSANHSNSIRYINQYWFEFMIKQNKKIPRLSSACSPLKTGIMLPNNSYINRYPRGNFECIGAGAGKRKFVCFVIWYQHHNKKFIDYDKQYCDSLNTRMYNIIARSTTDDGDLIIDKKYIADNLPKYLNAIVGDPDNKNGALLHVEIEKRQDVIDIPDEELPEL